MKIAIIGNGIAGSNAARFLRKLGNDEICMISGESEYPFSRTALMYIYMGHMKFSHTKLYEDSFWSKNRIEIVHKWIESVDFDGKIIQYTNGDTMAYDKLILATGSKPNKFGWPGQDLNGVQGMYSLQDLESMEEATIKGIKKAVVVGGGLIGVEMAEMFHSRGIPVTFLVREANFWNMVLPEEEATMVSKHIMAQGIDLRLGSELDKILEDGKGGVKAVLTKEGETIECNFVGLTVGVSPNIDFLKSEKLQTNRGILVNEFLQTNIEDVYAIGDCAELRTPPAGRRPIEAVWYTGRMMGQTVAHNICNSPQAYDPGIWYNSAKFFDIEYHVYGDIKAQKADNVSSFYWEHHTKPIGLRIDRETSTNRVLGFNLMGMRFRQEVCHHWIGKKLTISEVMKNLRLANFDPEFYDLYEEEIVAKYNSESGQNVVHKGQRKLSLVNKLLSKIK